MGNNDINESENDLDKNNIPNSDEKKSKNKEEKNNKSKFGIVKEIVFYVFLFFIMIYIVPNFIIQRTRVNGPSMEDTLHDEESLLVDKVSYRFSKPERYDIVVFYPNGRDDDKYYVKRVYGLPGETIQIKGDFIYINGKKIDDPYAKDSMLSAGIAEKPLKLGDDEYFVLGDHRSISEDSRYSQDEGGPGPVKFENIDGKVVLRIWPLDKFGLI